jgi:serine/threonine protein kinase
MPTGAAQQTPENGSDDTIPGITAEFSPLRQGRAIGGRYRPERPLAGRDRVWFARDTDGRGLILKTGARAVIAHERKLLSALAHPAIVELIDCVAVDADLVLVLEHLGGGDLVSLAGSAPSHWLGALAGVAAALDDLHRRGLVHRDLKARNVMFDAAGRVRLIDFGSAAAIGSPWTAAGTTAAATDPARSPEAVGPADDAYALAALLYEMIHGCPPGPGPLAAGGPPALAELIRDSLRPAKGSAKPAFARLAAGIESLAAKTSS